MKIKAILKWIIGGLVAALALFQVGKIAGKDKAENKINKQRIKGIKAAKQDMDDAENQDDDALADRLTAGRKLR